jgi:hypothetical protein
MYPEPCESCTGRTRCKLSPENPWRFKEWHPGSRGHWLGDGQYQLDILYTDPNELAMDILRYAEQVAIANETGTIKEAVRQRTQYVWELQGVGNGA